MKKLIILLLFVIPIMSFAQFYKSYLPVRDSTTLFGFALSGYNSLVLDEETGTMYQLLESATATDKLSNVSKRFAGGMAGGIGVRTLLVGEDSEFTYNTITEALAVVDTGDVILVLPGTYTGHIDVDVGGITIKSLGGWENTILSMTAVSSACMAITADLVVIDGFTLIGDAGFVVELGTNPDSVVIQNCHIDVSGTTSMGINVSTAGSTYFTVQDNIFTTDAGDGGIWMEKTNSDFVLDGNHFYGSDITSGYAFQTAGINNARIINNIIETKNLVAAGGYASGIFVYSQSAGAGADVDSIYIQNNIIKNCAKGVRIGHTSATYDIEDIWVTNNILSDNTSAVDIDADANVLAGTFEVVGNTFHNNTADITNANATALLNSANWIGGDVETGGLVTRLTTTYTPDATTASGTSVADDAAITVTNTIMRMVGADADAVLDTDPAIVDGAADGQIVYIFGTADANTVTIADAVNTQLAAGASVTLGIGDNICLIWDDGSSLWREVSRSDN